MKKIFLLTAVLFLLWASDAQAGITHPPTTRGLVGYWSMEDCKLTKATDSSGRGNTGTLTNFALTGTTSNWVAGAAAKRGSCALAISGSNDYVSTGLNIDTEPVSVALWIKPANTSQIGCFWCTDNGNWDKGVEVNSGTFQVHEGASLVPTSVAVIANVWQHVVAIYTSTDIILYVNGVQVWNRGIGPSADSGSSLELGRANYPGGSGSRGYSGSIDDVRVYNCALSANEILSIYNAGGSKLGTSTAQLQTGTSLTSGLVGHWTFDGKYLTTTKAKDTSGLVNDGTLNGANGKPVAKPGKLGQALIFDGTDDYVATAHTSTLTPTGDYTIAAWIRTSSSAAEQSVVTKFDASGVYPGYLCSVGRSNGSTGSTFGLSGSVYSVGFWVGDTATSWLVYNSSVNDGVWHHIVCRLSGTTASILVDGAQVASATRSPNRSNTGNFEIGRRKDTGRYFPGSIDDVRVYNRALSSSEITSLYKLGR